MESGNSLEKGLVQIYTGNGKGKTTAALGLAVRAIGQGLTVDIIQFMKQGKGYGEIETLQKLEGVSIASYGRKGFISKTGAIDEDKRLAAEAVERALEIMKSESCDLLILDEIINALYFDLISQETLEKLLDKRPSKMELVLTGRNAPEFLVDRADYVTEMREIKHPYNTQGIKSRKGIEF